jgi:DNA/RNA endonuclease YhcR with UshA esterase domain
MKLKKVFFILSIIGVLIVIFLSQVLVSTYVGKIESIKSSNGNVMIMIENSSVELVLFDAEFIDFKEGGIIEFQGRADVYMGKEQIIVDRISRPKGS